MSGFPVWLNLVAYAMGTALAADTMVRTPGLRLDIGAFWLLVTVLSFTRPREVPRFSGVILMMAIALVRIAVRH